MNANAELEQLLRELRDEGTLDSVGQFSLEASKARQKLAQRQQREAGLWITKLVQGAHLWEAQWLRLSQGRDHTRAIWHTDRPTDLAPWLNRLHEVEMMGHPHLGPLALAFQAALADGCDHVVLNPKSEALRLDESGFHGKPPQPTQEIELLFHYARKGPWWNPLLHLRPPRRALENFLAASRKASLALPKVEMDRFAIGPAIPAPSLAIERVWMSASPARELMLYPSTSAKDAILEEVDGRICERRQQAILTLRQWRADHHQSQGPITGNLADWASDQQANGRATPAPSQQSGMAVRGLIRWDLEQGEPARLIPVKYGITLEALPYPSLPTGVTIWLSSAHWRTDINQRKVVHDDTSRRLVSWAVDEFDLLVGESLQLLGDSNALPTEAGRLKAALHRHPNLQRAAPLAQAFPLL